MSRIKEQDVLRFSAESPASGTLSEAPKQFLGKYDATTYYLRDKYIVAAGALKDFGDPEYSGGVQGWRPSIMEGAYGMGGKEYLSKNGEIDFGRFLKDQWTDPYNLVVAAHLTASLLRPNYVSPTLAELESMAVEQYVTKPLDTFGKYKVFGSKGMSGSTFIYDIAYLELEEGAARSFGAMRHVLQGIENEAIRSGATSIEIRGYAVVAEGLNAYFLANQGSKLGYMVEGGGTRGSHVRVTKKLVND